jgi:predicted permease
VTVPAGSNGTANASVDNGSYDPDGDSITLTQSPAGPYPKGNTLVTLTVTDSKGASRQCTGMVTVKDITPPIAYITFCGVTTVNGIRLFQSDSNDFPIAQCNLEIVFTMEDNSTYTLPVTAFGTQLNSAMLMAFNERKSFWGCLNVILYPFKAWVNSAGFW